MSRTIYNYYMKLEGILMLADDALGLKILNININIIYEYKGMNM